VLRQGPKLHTEDRAWERRSLGAIDWLGRSGAQWRFLPAGYGGGNGVYKRFARRADRGVWARLFAAAAADPGLQGVLRDATVVRAHACAAGAPQQEGGKRRRGRAAPAAGAARSRTAASTPWAIRRSPARRVVRRATTRRRSRRWRGDRRRR